jgi:heat shock protein HslJ
MRARTNARIVLAGLLAIGGCSETPEPTANALDHLNAEYVIGGEQVRLVDGIAEVEAAPGSAAKIITRHFGNELRKDLDGDGREDVVFLLTQATGGSGTFFYVVAALAGDEGYRGSHGLLLGDRIAPQTTESGRANIVVVNFADRARGEPFSARPSTAKSIWLLLNPATMQFGEVAQDFEGEADPSRMTLGMTTWTWIRTTFGDARETTPRQPGRFTLTFMADGSFTATTDCNNMRGTYEVNGAAISFGPVAATRMYCADSQESEFAGLLATARGYRFTSRGELILELEGDGSAVLR